jgi:hypothetical protein
VTATDVYSIDAFERRQSIAPTTSSLSEDALRQIRPRFLLSKRPPILSPLQARRAFASASGVNFADVVGRLGHYPDLPPVPVVPGYEVVGRVNVVGAGVDPSLVGREVFALTRFGDAQFAMSRELDETERAEVARTRFSYILPVLRAGQWAASQHPEAVL